MRLNPEHHHPTARIHAQTAPANCRARFPGVEFFFQPADIVTQILNFGLPAPDRRSDHGRRLQPNYEIAQQIANRLRLIPGDGGRTRAANARVCRRIHLDMDRTRITQVGLTAQDVAQSVLVSLSGSFQTAPNFWLNPEQRSHLSDRGSGAAISDDVAARLDEYAGERTGCGRAGGTGQSGATHAGGASGGGQSLQCAAGHRCVCEHARARLGRSGIATS